MSEKKPDHIPPCLLPSLTRRRLLKGAAASAALAPIAVACGGLPGEFVTINQGDFEPLSFALSETDFAALATIGGLAYAKVESGGDSLEIVLVRSADDEILAFNHFCPHQNLGIGPNPGSLEMFWGEWLPEEKALRCRWHNSVFETDGTFNEGLSSTTGVANLPIYSVEFDATAGTGTVTF